MSKPLSPRQALRIILRYLRDTTPYARVADIPADRTSPFSERIPQRFGRAAKNANARASKCGARGVRLRARDLFALMQLQRGRCPYCGRVLSPHSWELDHTVPLVLGGTNAPSNICLVCYGCSRHKHQDIPESWAKRMRFDRLKEMLAFAYRNGPRALRARDAAVQRENTYRTRNARNRRRYAGDATHRGSVRTLQRTEYTANRESVTARRRHRYANDPAYRDLLRGISSRSRDRHREEINARARRRYAEDPEYRAAQNAACRRTAVARKARSAVGARVRSKNASPNQRKRAAERAAQRKAQRPRKTK